MAREGRFISVADLECCLDPTLPPDHVKFLSNNEASVFRIKGEASELVAKWPEKSDVHWRYRRKRGS